MAIQFYGGKPLFDKIRDSSLFQRFFKREEEVDSPSISIKQKKREEKKDIPWRDNPQVISSLEKGLEIDTRNATAKWHDLVNKHFGNDEMTNAINVMFKESSGRPDIIHSNRNGSKDYGLMQINDIHAKTIKKHFGYDMEDLLDPEKNLEVARWIYDRQGWQPWVGARILGLAR